MRHVQRPRPEDPGDDPGAAGQSGYETTTYTYDGNGNRLTTTAPPATTGGPSQVTTDTYNAAGQLASQTTGYGTSAAVDCLLLLRPERRQDVGGVRRREHLRYGAVLGILAVDGYRVTPQADYQTTYSYDSAGELVSTTTPATTAAPSGATTTSTYDPAGNKLTSTDPNGVTTTWTYTPLGQAATESYSGSSAHSVTYSYDASGNKTGMTDASGTSSIRLRPVRRATSATNGAGQTTSYGYDADGDVTGITYPLPGDRTWATTTTVSYGYDHADQLTGVTTSTATRSRSPTPPTGSPPRSASGPPVTPSPPPTTTPTPRPRSR